MRVRRGFGASAGVVSVGFGLGVAQLVAAIVNPQASPVIAVGQAMIDATPAWLKDFAIRTFGSKDKLALLTGIAIVLTLLAAGLGIASVRNLRAGLVGMAAFGIAGVLTSLTRPTSQAKDALPSVIGALAGTWMLSRLHRFLVADAEPETIPGPADGPVAQIPVPTGFDRRRFLVATGWGAAAAFAAGGVGRFLASRSKASTSRAAVRIPHPESALSSPAAETDLGIPGLSPFITPTDRFYQVDTALLPPAVTAEGWKLRIHGMVQKEMTIDYQQLLARPLVERDITLTCVSNPVGGHYISNARWVGALLGPILEEAGVAPGATQIVTTSVDGFTIGTPTEVVMDGRDAMLAVSMNGQPLPIAHGFPVRMIVPGLYGYVSAMKWIVDMELTTFEAFDAYWISRGWAQQAPIKTESRIDTPSDGAGLKVGQIPIAGVAWAQHSGVASVEVQVDGGAWAVAELSSQDTIDTWRQWVYRWDSTPGPHTLAARATDQTGYTQTETQAPPAPNGATGYHTITVKVS